MSRQLPVPLRDEPNGRALAIPEQQRPESSPLVRLAVAVAPDVLRAAERLVTRRAVDQQPRQPAKSMPARGFQISEVEIDFDMPFVRRVVVRNANAWSSFPDEPVVQERSSLRRAGQVIGMSGALALVAGIVVRRMLPGERGRVIDVEGRRRD